MLSLGLVHAQHDVVLTPMPPSATSISQFHRLASLWPRLSPLRLLHPCGLHSLHSFAEQTNKKLWRCLSLFFRAWRQAAGGRLTEFGLGAWLVCCVVPRLPAPTCHMLDILDGGQAAAGAPVSASVRAFRKLSFGSGLGFICIAEHLKPSEEFKLFLFQFLSLGVCGSAVVSSSSLSSSSSI